MIADKMYKFMQSVCTLHESHSGKAQPMLPNIVLKRLPLETIQKYSGTCGEEIHMPATSASVKSPPSFKFPSNESKSRNIQDNGNRKTAISFIDSSGESSSESLPDLDVVYRIGPKRVKKKREWKLKQREAVKTQPTLMKNAIEVFQHKAKRFKSSKEYIRNLKNQTDNAESLPDDSNVLTHLMRLNDSDLPQLTFSEPATSSPLENYASDTMPQLTTARPVTPLTDKNSSAIESSRRLISDIAVARDASMAKSLTRYTEADQSVSQSEDASDSGMESMNAVDPLQIERNEGDHNQRSEFYPDSDDSQTTIIYDVSDGSDTICHIASVQSLSKTGTIGDTDSNIILENGNSPKKMEISSDVSDSESRRKNMQKDQENIDTDNALAEIPMVIIPLPNTNAESDQTSSSTISETHMPRPTHDGNVVSAVSSHSDRTSIQNKETLASSKDNIGVSKDTRKLANQNETPIASGSDVLNSVNIEGKATRDSNMMAVKSFKELSLNFQELTDVRAELDKKIEELKKEYHKKIEILEEQKKKCDLDIKALIDAMSTWKEQPKGEEHSSADQQESAVDESDANNIRQPASTEVTTTPTYASPSTTTNVRTYSKSKTTKTSHPRKRAINIIPDASIKIFGTAKQLPIKATPPAEPPLETVVTSAEQQSTGHLGFTSQSSAILPPTQGEPYNVSKGSGSQAVVQPRSNVSAIEKQSSITRVFSQAKPVSQEMASHFPPPQANFQRYLPIQMKQTPPNTSVQHQLNQQQSQPHQQQQYHQKHYLQQRQQHPQSLQQKINYQHQIQQQKHQLHNQQLQQQHKERHEIEVITHKHPTMIRQKPNNQQQKVVFIQNQQLQRQNQNIALQPVANITPADQQFATSEAFVQQNQQAQGHMLTNAVLLQDTGAGFSQPSVMAASSSSSISWGCNQVVANAPLISHANVIPSMPQNANQLVTQAPSNIEKTHCIPTNSSNFVQSLQSQAINNAISSDHPSIVSDKTNQVLPTQALQSPGNNSQAQTMQITLATSLSNNSAGDLNESEPICVVCGNTGIFTCCRDIIYCNTICQSNDWENHKQGCTNT